MILNVAIAETTVKIYPTWNNTSQGAMRTDRLEEQKGNVNSVGFSFNSQKKWLRNHKHVQ